MVRCLVAGALSCGEMKPEQFVGGMGARSRTFPCWWLWWLDSVSEHDVPVGFFSCGQ